MWPFVSEKQKEKIRQVEEQERLANQDHLQQEEEKKKIEEEENNKIQELYPIGHQTEYLGYPVYVVKAEIYYSYIEECKSRCFVRIHRHFERKFVIHMQWMDEVGHVQRDNLCGDLEMIKKFIKPKSPDPIASFPEDVLEDGISPV